MPPGRHEVFTKVRSGSVSDHRSEDPNDRFEYQPVIHLELSTGR